ncbi:MAG: chemotaxis protein CheD [Chloroherpetonaceae bacterium]|nr:chemotaxis protein CheD [Chthonomonadaceae bacterium]MDW8206488.1 chemotaxis protein CheD [Chloroherpetonaceae bacterium]
MAETLMVGMGEVKITRSAGGVLIALGLGSCIGVCAYDPQARVAGMAHVVLPDSAGNTEVPGKFADTAIPFLVEAMRREGASVTRIRVALAGGAQLFRHQGTGARLDVGPRNAEAVQAALERLNIYPVAMDVGGSAGRTVHLYHDGVVRVKTIGQPERDLAALGDPERAYGGNTFRTNPAQGTAVVPLRKAA